MGDDWDDVITAPAKGSAGGSWNDNNNKGGVKPPAGRGRGAAMLVSQMSNVKIAADDEWGVAVKPASSSNGWDAPVKATGNSNGWGASTVAAPASSGGWDPPTKTSQFDNDVEDQPRGGGWGSSGGGGGYVGAGGGGGSRSCHKVS